MTHAGFRVRAAGVGDLAEVVEMERGIVGAPHWAEAEYAGMIPGDGGTVKRSLLVAEASGGLVGFAVGKVIGDVAELESVAVRPEARRGGVAKALCLEVAAWCKELGAGVLELEVREGNEGAMGLYLRLGFVVVGRRRGYYREPVEDAVLMRLELGGSDKGAGDCGN
jgi:[ribosomal protein S18]-alanine N-acetyltransferase